MTMMVNNVVFAFLQMFFCILKHSKLDGLLTWALRSGNPELCLLERNWFIISFVIESSKRISISYVTLITFILYVSWMVIKLQVLECILCFILVLLGGVAPLPLIETHVAQPPPPPSGMSHSLHIEGIFLSSD